MRLTIRVAGAAGLGMNSTADIIANVFARLGYEINTDIYYQSLIKGGLNYFDIFVDRETKYISMGYDILLALDAKNLEKWLPDAHKKNLIITNIRHKEKLEKTGIDLEKYNFLTLKIDAHYDNMYLIAALSHTLGLDEQVVQDYIAHIFSRKGEAVVSENLKIFSDIKKIKNTDKNIFGNYPKIGNPKKISYGNKMLADGAIASELEYYSAYPMTPASSLLTEIVADGSVKYLQAEDEIAVAMSALGASFTGARAMVGTSGGGFALMVESISFAQQAEIPLVMVLSQRAGPSTGTPTFFEQGDIRFALYPSFGDFEHIVLVPDTLETAYTMAGQALNLAQKYQTVVIILTDKQFSEGKVTLDNYRPAPVQRGKLESSPAADFARYAFTDDGISPYVQIGTENGDFIATSYQHDTFGATSEDENIKTQMTEKHHKKLKKFFVENDNIEHFEYIHPDAKKIFVTLSYTSYTAKQTVIENPEYGLLIIKTLKPLHPQVLRILSSKKEIIFVESNYSGQLQEYICAKLKPGENIKIFSMRKYNLLPFYIEDFQNFISNSQKNQIGEQD